MSAVPTACALYWIRLVIYFLLVKKLSIAMLIYIMSGTKTALILLLCYWVFLMNASTFTVEWKLIVNLVFSTTKKFIDAGNLLWQSVTLYWLFFNGKGWRTVEKPQWQEVDFIWVTVTITGFLGEYLFSYGGEEPWWNPEKLFKNE